MSNLSIAVSFSPNYAMLPEYLSRSAVAISPRFPRNGIFTATPASGTTGTAGTITPERSAIEAQAWGATVALWSYTDLAASYGYASPSAFVSEFTAAGIPIQATTNTRAVNPSTGPFMKDAGGSDWSAGSAPTRPLVGGNPQSPAASRVPVTIDYMPAADAANTQAPKLTAIAGQMAAGCFGLHMDDPRGGAAYCHWTGAESGYDAIGQGADFSPTAITGFTAWLAANTTSSQRIALGLPSSTVGFDLLVHLKTNYASVMFTAGQDNGTLVDNFLFRTSISSNTTLRAIMTLHARFLRDDHAAYVQAIRTQLAGAPLSQNLWNASPMEYLNWHARRTPQLWDFAVAETAPPYWAELSANAVGSAGFHAAREVQNARQHMNAVACDFIGLRAFFEHKPTALNTAPARVVVQLMRQSIMQSVMEGASPVVPIDVFMTTNDGAYSQGVDVDGYRFWGGRADYKSCFDFIKANASLLDGYEKLAQVVVEFHSDTFPFHSGGQSAKFQTLMTRLAELWRRDVDYHMAVVGSPSGLLPAEPVRAVELSAPITLRLQDDADYHSFLGRLTAPKSRRWSTQSADEAMGYSPVRSTNPYVRATARYNAAEKRVSVHLHNYAVNADGTPSPQTTTLLWNWGGAGVASVTRLGESAGSVDLSKGSGSVALTEYAIVNFAVN